MKNLDFSRQAGILFASMFLWACAGTNFKWEDTERIEPGMTENEVIAILGEPYGRSKNGDKVTLIWSYSSSFGGARAVSFLFEDGRVVEQSTEFGK